MMTDTTTELQKQNDELFEDSVRQAKVMDGDKCNQTSPYCDWIYYPSTKNPELTLAMRVLKPEKPSYILARTHGWHMSIPEYQPMDTPDPSATYLIIDVDMRGRAFSEGCADCNSWELYDIIDAVNYVREHYQKYIVDPEVVYFDGGSGGGGNAYALAGKFPDFFSAISASCGISDYALWYEQDETGEFRDEMDIWVGGTPTENRMAYDARGGLHLIENLATSLMIVHGQTDIRVPVDHARNYIERAKLLGKDHLIQYLELEGVGTRNHFGNELPDQTAMRIQLIEENKIQNRSPVEIPERGRMVVGGYLFTKKFSVVLDCADKMAVVEYDLPQRAFRVYSDVVCAYDIVLK